MFDPPVITTGTIVDSPKENIYNIKLPNGKKTIGHVAKAMKHLHPSLHAGVKVKLELTPYDFEKARISEIIEETA